MPGAVDEDHSITSDWASRGVVFAIAAKPDEAPEHEDERGPFCDRHAVEGASEMKGRPEAKLRGSSMARIASNNSVIPFAR
jgi:hypothetical protein